MDCHSGGISQLHKTLYAMNTFGSMHSWTQCKFSTCSIQLNQRHMISHFVWVFKDKYNLMLPNFSPHTYVAHISKGQFIFCKSVV